MKLFIAPLILLLGFSAQADWDFDYKGELRLESRVFENDDNPDTYDQAYSVFAKPEFTMYSEDTGVKLKGSLLARAGLRDSERSIVYIEDAYVEKDFGELQIFAGFRVVNWSTAEAFHPSDIINSRNFDTQFENAEKLGEPMLGFSKQMDDYGFQAFYMPYLEASKFTSFQNRVSFFPNGVDVLTEEFVDKDGERLDDFAAQWAFKASLSKWGGDWSLYWVHHLDRTQANFHFNIGPVIEVTPIFTEVDQVGLNLQQQVGDFIVKFEGAYRAFPEEEIQSQDFGLLTFKSHSVIAGGAEYTHGWDGGSETTFLTETQFIDGVGRADRRALGLFQRDFLLGARHSINDANSKEILVIGIVDLELSRQLMVSVTYSQRIFKSWKFKIGGRYIDAPNNLPLNQAPSDLRVFDGDNQLYFEISRFF